MTFFRRILFITLLACLVETTFAQMNDWAVVTHLSPGQKVRVQTADGKSHDGSLRTATDDGIQIGKNPMIPKQDVRQLMLMSPSHRGRNTLIGLGVGAGVGTAMGLACTGEGLDFGKGSCIAVFAPFFGGIGAAIGAVLPSHGRWQEVYRTPAAAVAADSDGR